MGGIVALLTWVGLSIVGLIPFGVFAWYTGYVGHRRDRY